MHYYYTTFYRPSVDLFKLTANKYLSLLPLGKNGNNNWVIRVKNETIVNMQFTHNNKMCNFNDGKNWTGLLDNVNAEVKALSYNEITVSPNWFAATIALSWLLKNGTRFITYADNIKN